MALGANEDIYVCGYFNFNMDADPGPGSRVLTSNGNYDLFVAKYSKNGDYIWAFNLGSSDATYGDAANGIALDSKENLYITGKIGPGTVDLNPASGSNTVINNNGNDILLAKYSAEGKYLWGVNLGNMVNHKSSYGKTVAVDKEDAVYVAGSFNAISGNEIDFDAHPTRKHLMSAVDDQDIFVMKYNKNGGFSWAFSVGTTGFKSTQRDDNAESIALDAMGNVYIGGVFRDGSADFSLGIQPSSSIVADKYGDIYTAAYDSTGVYKWAFTTQGDVHTGTADITHANYFDDGVLYIAGHFTGTGIDFDPSSSVKQRSVAGEYNHDAFLAAYGEGIQLALLSKTDNLCYGDKKGAIELQALGGTPPYSYTWGASKYQGAFVNGLPAGTYTITVTDKNQESANIMVEITQPPALELSIGKQDSKCDASTGSATVTVSGGTPPYRYYWTNGDTLATATQLSSGFYVVTVVDAKGCQEIGHVNISDEEGPVINVNQVQDVLCHGDKTGAIDIKISNGTPPYDIMWSNGERTEDIVKLAAGPYEVSVSDKNKCSSIKAFVIHQPLPLLANIISSNASCDSANGAATVAVSGGVAPYTYQWSTGDTTNIAEGLAAGTYSVMVRDSNACNKVKTTTISENNAPVITLDSVKSSSCGNPNGNIYVTVGSGNIQSLLWSDGSSNEDIENVLPGTYTLTVTDTSGCQAIMEATVETLAPSNNGVCLVTVDTLTHTNHLVWEKTALGSTVKFNIYKESSQPGVYYKIGSMPADSLSVFTDTLSNPLIRSWRYKIAAEDSCGNETELSSSHKTIHLVISKGLGGAYNLLWDKYDGFDYTTFFVYRYTDTEGWTLLDSLPNTLFTFTDYPSNTDNLYYRIEVQKAQGCLPEKAGENKSRSNIGNTAAVTGMLTIDHFENLILSPNPSEGKIRVSGFKSDSGPVYYEVYNLLGEKLLHQQIKNTKVLSLDLSAQRSGIYMIRIYNNHQYKALKFVLE